MLEIKNVSKKYKDKQALKPLSFKLGKGVYALLGPNGAGKSTLMNIMTDNLKTDSGNVLWQGQDLSKLGSDFRRILGYAPQQQGLYEDMTLSYFLRYLATLKMIPKKSIDAEVKRVTAIVNLEDQLHRKLGTFSGGMKQRALIAQAILGKPELIILDEPTAGLDPKERVRIRNLCERLGKEATVLVATHVVSDIETIAKEVLILKAGVVIAKESPINLINQFAPEQGLEEVYLEIFGGEA